jgi:hypothetical protein
MQCFFATETNWLILFKEIIAVYCENDKKCINTLSGQNAGYAGLIPDEVSAFFIWPNPSSRTMALGSTQSLTEMSIRNIPGGKGPPAGA